MEMHICLTTNHEHAHLFDNCNMQHGSDSTGKSMYCRCLKVIRKLFLGCLVFSKLAEMNLGWHTAQRRGPFQLCPILFQPLSLSATYWFFQCPTISHLATWSVAGMITSFYTALVQPSELVGNIRAICILSCEQIQLNKYIQIQLNSCEQIHECTHFYMKDRTWVDLYRTIIFVQCTCQECPQVHKLMHKRKDLTVYSLMHTHTDLPAYSLMHSYADFSVYSLMQRYTIKCIGTQIYLCTL